MLSEAFETVPAPCLLALCAVSMLWIGFKSYGMRHGQATFSTEHTRQRNQANRSHTADLQNLRKSINTRNKQNPHVIAINSILLRGACSSGYSLETARSTFDVIAGRYEHIYEPLFILGQTKSP